MYRATEYIAEFYCSKTYELGSKALKKRAGNRDFRQILMSDLMKNNKFSA